MSQLSFFEIDKPLLRGGSGGQAKPSRLRKSFDGQAGEILRDKGMIKAVEHAGQVHDQWQMKALDFLYVYALGHGRFSGEMVRLEARGIVPDAPSARAWGSVVLTAARKGWIRQIGYIKVNNPAAHRTPATLWESCL